MSQYSWTDIVASTEDGTDLATRLNDWRDALETMHSGTSRPTGAQTGMIWADTTVAGVTTIQFYDGTNDIALFEIDRTNSEFDKSFAPPVLLHEDDAGAGSPTLEVTSTSADSFDELRIQIVNVGWTSANVHFDASSAGGAPWDTLFLGAQNASIGTSQDSTNPIVGGDLELTGGATATGLMSGDMIAMHDGSDNHLRVNIGFSTSSNISVNHLYTILTATKWDAFRLAATSGNLTGKLRLWGMPQV